MASKPLGINNNYEIIDEKANKSKINIFGLAMAFKKPGCIILVEALKTMKITISRETAICLDFSPLQQKNMVELEIISDFNPSTINEDEVEVDFKYIFQALKEFKLTLEGFKFLQIKIPEEFNEDMKNFEENKRTPKKPEDSSLNETSDEVFERIQSRAHISSLRQVETRAPQQTVLGLRETETNSRIPKKRNSRTRTSQHIIQVKKMNEERQKIVNDTNRTIENVHRSIDETEQSSGLGIRPDSKSYKSGFGTRPNSDTYLSNFDSKFGAKE